MYDIQKIKTKSLQSQVYTKLKEQLMQGAWKAGEKLPSEHALCALFGVSRVTVRAAIQQLVILGMVEARHGGGTFVKTFSAIENVDNLHPLIQISQNRDLITVLEYRKIIEKGTIGLAWEKIKHEDIEILEETLQIMINTEDLAVYTEADLAFHHHLARITQNPIIIKVHDLISEILTTAMYDLVSLVGKEIGPAYHRRIIDTLKGGGKAECEAVMEEHMEENIRAVRKLENPDKSSSAGAALPEVSEQG
ncbi:MAG: FadR family transcriptional regulator [Treponema sp.]|jgi:GntR family transcriptional repressor for pyruvate dehydrogenase complex|nr:FadR family transcriptional regulator [Treponema sp.]